MGCDANAYHTSWGSSNVNLRGQILAEFLAASDMYWCNIGNTPTIRVANRKEVNDITLANPLTFNRVTNWQVSENPSLSDHAFITFTIHLKIVGGRWIRSNKADCDLYWQLYFLPQRELSTQWMI